MSKTLPKRIKQYFAQQGSIGGIKGSALLTPEQLKERSKRALTARWKDHVKKEKKLKQ